MSNKRLGKVIFLIICLTFVLSSITQNTLSDRDDTFQSNQKNIKTANNWSEDLLISHMSELFENGSGFYPKIAIYNNHVHIVYQQYWAKPYRWYWEIGYLGSDDLGKTWNKNINITYETYGSSMHPEIATQSNSIYIVWEKKISGQTKEEIYFKNSSDDGITWQNDTALTSNDGYMSKEPCIATNENNLHVIWVDERSGSNYYELFYKRSTDSGTTWDDGLGNIGEDRRLTTCIPPYADYLPAVAVNGSNLHVIWTHYDGNTLIKYMKSYNNGSNWSEPITVSVGGYFSDSGKIAVNASNLHVVWTEERDENKEIYYRNSTDNGNTWNPEVVRLTNTTADEYDPRITVNGSWVWVSWWSTGDNCGYYRLSKDNGATWEDTVQLTTQSGTPILAVSDGYVHAVFTSDRTGNSEIYYKRNPKFNNPPEINNYYPQANVTITETQTQLFSVNATDLDNDILTYQWYLNNTPLTDETNYSYTFIPGENFSGNYSVKVSVCDGEEFANHTWVVTVINVGHLQQTINELQNQLNQSIANYTALQEIISHLNDNLSSVWNQLNESLGNNTELKNIIGSLSQNLTIIWNELNQSLSNNTSLQSVINQLNNTLNISTTQISALWAQLNQSSINETALWNQISALNENITNLQTQIAQLEREKEQVESEREQNTRESWVIIGILLAVVVAAWFSAGLVRRKKE